MKLCFYKGLFVAFMVTTYLRYNVPEVRYNEVLLYAPHQTHFTAISWISPLGGLKL